MKGLYTILLVVTIGVFYSMPAYGQQSDSTTYSRTTIEPAPIEITVVDNRIKVKNVTIGSKLEIYSVVGIKVKEIEMKETSGEYVVNIAKGYYIIRIGETVRKVAIR